MVNRQTGMGQGRVCRDRRQHVLGQERVIESAKLASHG